MAQRKSGEFMSGRGRKDTDRQQRLADIKITSRKNQRSVSEQPCGEQANLALPAFAIQIA